MTTFEVIYLLFLTLVLAVAVCHFALALATGQFDEHKHGQSLKEKAPRQATFYIKGSVLKEMVDDGSLAVPSDVDREALERAYSHLSVKVIYTERK